MRFFTVPLASVFNAVIAGGALEGLLQVPCPFRSAIAVLRGARVVRHHAERPAGNESLQLQRDAFKLVVGVDEDEFASFP